VFRVRGRSSLVVFGLVAASCGGGSRPTPATTAGPSTTTPAASTSPARAPTLSAAAIPGLGAPSFHAGLRSSGFASTAPGGTSGFVTTTSKRADATVTTYGRGPDDVVKIIAEVGTAAALDVLATVVAAVAKGPEAKRADAWLKAGLKMGPINATRPRSTVATFAMQPFELLVTASTATLSIGRVAG